LLNLLKGPLGQPQARVLCYHAVQDIADPGPTAPYIMPVAAFERQLDAILADGWTFVTGDAFAAAHRAAQSLPPRSVLLTFDDGFDDLETIIAPLLLERGIPAVAFVVTQRLGQTNLWDAQRGGPPLRLHDAAALHRLRGMGFDIAPHTRTHPRLTDVAPPDLAAEVAGARSDLTALGFPESPFFAYPYGAYDARVVAATRQAGLPFAMAVGRFGRLSLYHPLKLPRIVILRGQDAVAALNAS